MTVRILQGDCREVLKTLPDRSVHCVVTSPPYFRLRDYGTARWEGGGDPDCDHKPFSDESVKRHQRNSTLGGGKTTQKVADEAKWFKADGSCPRCGARRVDQQIGLEQTPDEYVAALVDVFREVRRVLRDDGTVWLNLGDSYAGGGAANGWREGSARADGEVSSDGQSRRNRNGNGTVQGLKQKDLIGIPWMVAFALRADGWWLRQDIIWTKPNPMPESVVDRCTKAHEYIFLLSKSARYFYDSEAIAEDAKDWSSGGPGTGINETFHYGANNGGNGGLKALAQRYKSSGNKERKPASARGVPVDSNGSTNGAVAGSVPWTGLTRNKRSVWEVVTQPYSEAHFATFPAALVEPCIKAGSPELCCENCGAPHERVVERDKHPTRDVEAERARDAARTGRTDGKVMGPAGKVDVVRTVGFAPSCNCNAETKPGVVLDPFGGAGTTGLVADRLRRDAVLVELNPAYADMARRRLIGDAGMFADVSVAATTV